MLNVPSLLIPPKKAQFQHGEPPPYPARDSCSSPPTPAAGTPQNYEEALRIAEAREREVRGYFDKYDLDGSGTAARSKCCLGSDRARVQRLLRTPSRSSHPRG